MTLTNAQLQRMNTALAILGNRKMANLGADLKVARLLRALAPLVEPLDALKRATVLEMYLTEVPEGATLTPTQEQVLGMAIRAKQAELDEKDVEVELPMQFALQEADLPKELAGKEGAANASALGAIITDLGPLYIFTEVEG